MRSLFAFILFSGDGDERKRPVIIHRAILGSVERMMAILTENYGGKWPFWISPRQAIVIPVSPKFDEYANKVCFFYYCCYTLIMFVFFFFFFFIRFDSKYH